MLRLAGGGRFGVRVIAITGGIGSGKTTIANYYRSLGVDTIDADAISRELTAPEGEALPAIREAFGDAVFHADGTLDRGALAKAVFQGNTQNLQRLNAILHPLITDRIRVRLTHLRQAGRSAVILDVPLLFETGMDVMADAVICVTAPLAVRIERICKRDDVTQEQALQRISNQNAAERTEMLSDYVLTTDAPLIDTQKRAYVLWQQVLADGPKRAIR